MSTIYRIFICIALSMLAGCSFGPTASQAGLVAEISAPTLPTFSGTSPTSVGDLTQDRALGRGDSLFVSNGDSILWIRRLGTNAEGRSKWQCEINPNVEGPCQVYVGNGIQEFHWNGLKVAEARGENGKIFVASDWRITNTLPSP